MRHLVLTAIFVVTLPRMTVGADERIDEKELCSSARRIIDVWNGDQPVQDKRCLQLVCWTPADREFPADYQSRLTRIMEHIQNFYAREMERFGFRNRSFRLPSDKSGQLVLHAVRGLHEADHYSLQSGKEIRQECLPKLEQAGIDASRETVVIFCNLATWDEQKRTFSHKSPYYASGSFRSGTAWQLDSAELDTANLKLVTPMIQDGQYGRISLGKHNSIFIGGIAHELGHALGLPHCKARPDEAVRGTALMGAGNRTYGDEIRNEGPGSFLSLAHALRLASHPLFTDLEKALDEDGDSTIDDLSIIAKDKSLCVSGVVRGNPPIYAVVAYFDPADHDDYDSTTAVAVPDDEGRFSLCTSALQRGRGGQMRLFALHANGAVSGRMSQTKFRYPYHIKDDGTPDLSAREVRNELEPVLTALNQKDRRLAANLASKMKSAQAAAIAEHLTQPRQPSDAPAEYRGESTSIALTEFKPSAALVGWLTPTFNQIPDRSRLLEAGGRLFETGIYAHAPGRHVYRLGGKWKSLAGKVGLAFGRKGSVQFEIKGDGKTLWKSRVLREDMLGQFEVRLQGIQELELLTHPTDDGTNSDWALWLEPMLRR